MNTSGELIAAWRRSISDEAEPYLWADADAILYADAAYRQFVRNIGGIHDFTSDVTRVPVVAEEPLANVSPLILRFDMAVRGSDGREITIVNWTDRNLLRRDDYGTAAAVYNERGMGEVNYMVIGNQKGVVKWVRTPVVDDEVQLQVYRLPLERIVDDTHDLSEVDEDYHIHLIDWMKHLAYLKQDAETYDPRASEEAAARFMAKCREAKAEMDRYRSKVRVVQYGGL